MIIIFQSILARSLEGFFLISETVLDEFFFVLVSSGGGSLGDLGVSLINLDFDGSEEFELVSSGFGGFDELFSHGVTHSLGFL